MVSSQELQYLNIYLFYNTCWASTHILTSKMVLEHSTYRQQSCGLTYPSYASLYGIEFSNESNLCLMLADDVRCQI